MFVYFFERLADQRSVDPVELEGPIIVLVCEPHSSNQAEVELPARLLAKFSEPVALVAALDRWNPPAGQVIGRLTLPHVDATLAKQVVSYLQGECFEVSAKNRSGNAVSKRNLTRLIQASSMAHMLGIDELQRGALHGLLHFLIIYKQVFPDDELRLELKRLFSGCPGQLILRACLHREESEPAPTPSEAPGPLATSKGLAKAESLLAAALHPDAEWDWKALKMSVWKSMSKNRGLEDLWNHCEQFLASRKTFSQARTDITAADPFWRRGGARGAVLSYDLPSWCPKKSAEYLEIEKKQWLEAQRQRLSKARRLQKSDVPAIVVTSPTPEVAKAPSAVESQPSQQPVVHVDESTGDASYPNGPKASGAAGPDQVEDPTRVQAQTNSVVEDDELIEISREEWLFHQSSKQNMSAS